MATKNLLSVKNIILLKKDCHKMCVEGIILLQKDCYKMCDDQIISSIESKYFPSSECYGTLTL